MRGVATVMRRRCLRDTSPTRGEAARAGELLRDVSSRAVLHVVELLVPPYPVALMPDSSALDAAAQEELDLALESLHHELPHAQGVLSHGHPSEQIVSYAEKNFVDLVVVGTHGRKGPSRWVMGSVAEKVVRSCRSPVLTVHEHDVSRARPADARAP